MRTGIPIFVFCLVGSVMLLSSSPTLAQGSLADLEKRIAELESNQGFLLKWKNGLRFESPDGLNKVALGGRVQVDFAYFDQDSRNETNVGDAEDGVEFRRSRVAISGVIAGNVEFKAQYDFAGGDADFKDMFVGLLDLWCLGNVRVGQQFEPMGLEEQTSSKYNVFMERSHTSALLPGRNTGVLMRKSLTKDKALTLQAGIFRDVNGFGDGQDDGAHGVTARLTYVIAKKEDGQVHLGISVSSRKPGGDSVSYSNRPLAHLAPVVVSTGSITADAEDIVGLEAAWACGPLSIQGEYVMTTVDRDGASDPDFTAWYAMVSYFLTGERRPYKQGPGVFSRVKPQENYDGKGGKGAVELAARISSIDLNDGGITGGEADSVTLGANWYLNPNARVMLNIVQTDVDGSGDIISYMTRFAVNF